MKIFFALGTSRLSRPVSRGTEGSKTSFDDQVSTSSIEERIGALQLVDFVSTNTDNAISDKVKQSRNIFVAGSKRKKKY